VALDLLTLRNGNVVFAFNDTKEGRTPLTLAVSSDDCETWEVFRDLETDPGECSYPTLIQDNEGNIHITYTYKRERIKHVVVNEAWIRQGENRVLKVKDVIKG
jgi:predicted neuraminidase